MPGLLKDRFEQVEGGSGNFLSFGLTVKASDKITLRGGPAFWSMPFIPTGKGTYNGTSALAKETGTLSFSGIYIRLDRNWDYFYLSGGFDFSFGKSYTNDLEIRNTAGTLLVKSNNQTTSIFTSDFYNQANLVLGLGPTIPVGKHFKLRGNLSAVIPFSTIYNSGVVAKQIYITSGQPAPDAKVNLRYLPFVSYGLSIAYSF
ncbi:MAG: hypothetical protein ACKO96_40640 [Flammeovirgaceae bacterium]